MEGENNTNTENIITDPSSVKFILLLIVEIPSILCALLILTYLLVNWHLLVKKAVRNHVILLLIIISLIYLTLDLPFSISSFRLGYDYFRSPSFCLWWYWIDYTLTGISIFLTAAASIQRHILIFNAHYLHLRRTRWLLHFLPILICLVYPPIFYFVVIVIHPCEYSVDDDSQYCDSPCYTDNFVLFNFDWIFNTAFPLTVITLANITLIIRVIRSVRKTRRQQPLFKKRQRKMTFQLLALSSLYVFGWAPSTVISILQSFNLPNLLDDIPQLDYLNYITYFVCPLQPLICLLALPELIKSVKSKAKRVICRSAVAPLRTIQGAI